MKSKPAISFFLPPVLLAASMMVGSLLPAQIQRGQDLEGVQNDAAGWSVSMPDAQTVGIGCYLATGSGPFSGLARVYGWNGNSWVQKGQNLNGEADNDGAGAAVSMPDANTIAVAAIHNNDGGTAAGHVRVYAWDGSAWQQKGADVDGESVNERSGFSVSMPDAQTVAIGAYYNSATANQAGTARVYTWNGNAWVQQGQDIAGQNAGDWCGYAVSMPDANTLAVSAAHHDGGGAMRGQVRVFTWNGNAWVQQGADINGEADNDMAGYSVSMPDAQTIAVGAYRNDGNGVDAGHVRVYTWNGTAWVQKGADIEGEAAGDYLGGSVSMPDANTLAAGAPQNDGNGAGSGSVRIFTWDGTAWVQRGTDIDGETVAENAGTAVSMPDANTVAIGAPANADAGFRSGQVRVYGGISVGVEASDFGTQVQAWPNPTKGRVTIRLGAQYSTLQVTVRNALGQECLQQTLTQVSQAEVELPQASGLYWVELVSGDKHATLRLVQQ